MDIISQSLFFKAKQIHVEIFSILFIVYLTASIEKKQHLDHQNAQVTYILLDRGRNRHVFKQTKQFMDLQHRCIYLMIH